MELIKEGTHSVLLLPQRFSGASAKSVKEFVMEAFPPDVSSLIIDFAETEFVDSFGIGTLVLIAKTFKMQSKTLVLRNLSEDINELFCDTDLDKIFSISKDNETLAAEINLFETSVDIKLDIRDEPIGDILVMHLAGLMNFQHGSKYFKQQILLALAQYHKILLDLEELTFLDSMSVSVIIMLNKLIKETGAQMRMYGANYIVADLFETLSISKLFPVFDTQEMALAEWK